MRGQVIVRRGYERLSGFHVKQSPLFAPLEDHNPVIEILNPIVYGWHDMAGLQIYQAAFVVLGIGCDPVFSRGLDSAIFRLYNIVSLTINHAEQVIKLHQSEPLTYKVPDLSKARCNDLVPIAIDIAPQPVPTNWHTIMIECSDLVILGPDVFTRSFVIESVCVNRSVETHIEILKSKQITFRRIDVGMLGERYLHSRPIHKTEPTVRRGIGAHRYPNKSCGGIGLNPRVLDRCKLLALGTQQTAQVILLYNGVFGCGAPYLLVFYGLHEPLPIQIIEPVTVLADNDHEHFVKGDYLVVRRFELLHADIPHVCIDFGVGIVLGIIFTFTHHIREKDVAYGCCMADDMHLVPVLPSDIN